MTAPRFDFSLRPNKAIERKLIFEALAALGRAFDWKRYQYVGLGSMWFRDFVLAHRLLLIDHMHSIEVSPDIAARSVASRPFKCIRVHEGRASKVLLSPELAIKERKSIVWLDYYDTATDETLGDMDRLCRDLPLGSILLVTLNGEIDSLGYPRADAQAALRRLFGDWVPVAPSLDYFGPALNHYPKQLSQLVWARALRTARASGRDLCPLFNFAYKDGAPMITVGGVVSGSTEIEAVSKSGVRERLGVLTTGNYDASEGWPKLLEQSLIEVPVLTRLERLRLNRELPGKLAASTVKKLCGDSLTAEQRDAYSQFFIHYPSYAEFDL
jgi:hypothetical protein